MTRLALLLLVAALAVPGTAVAQPPQELGGAQPRPAPDLTAPDRDAGTRAALDADGVDQAAADRKAPAIEEYYASYGTVKPPALPAATTETPASGHDGPSWIGALGIGLGLILIAGGLGVYAGRSVRPRHLGA